MPNAKFKLYCNFGVAILASSGLEVSPIYQLEKSNTGQSVKRAFSSKILISFNLHMVCAKIRIAAAIKLHMLCAQIWKAQLLISFHSRCKAVSSSTRFLSTTSLRLRSTEAATMAAKHPKDEAYLNATIPKRIQLFQSIQAQLLADRRSLPSAPIKLV